VSGQHPTLNLSNTDDGGLTFGGVSPCESTTARALLMATSTQQFFACKVWIFRSFKGGSFFLIPLLWDSRSSREVLLQRGGLA
jgi:hypothetical protein